MTEIEIESEFLDVSFAKKHGVKSFIFIEEAKPETGNFGTKYIGKAQLDGDKPCIKKVSLNKTSAKKLIAMYGTESKNWMGKPIPIVLVNQQTKDGLKEIIYVDPNAIPVTAMAPTATTTATPPAQNSGTGQPTSS